MSLTLEYDEVIETNGIKVPFVPRIITPKIERPMRNSRYEGGECAALREILRPGDRVLELGSGVGLISTVAALVQGISRVTTVEANPDLIPLIRETHRLNDALSVDLRNGVVVATDRKRAPFYLRADFWASSMEAESRPHVKKKHLDCISIHSLIKEVNPTVIVCDIEGGELGLFDDADLSGVRSMVLEFHPKVYGAENVEAITASLVAKGLEHQVSDKPSSVRRFERPTVARVSAPTKTPAVPSSVPNVISSVGAVSPRLTGLNDKPWNPKDARFLVTTCMKDEGPFILEWLAWHKAIGIQDFVIFTNDCTDGTDLLLDRLEEMGQLRHLPNPALATASATFQPFALAYTPFLSEFRRADFYISMDVDEFINIRLGDGKMTDLLEKTGPFDALSISELNHGSNRIEEYQRGFVTDLFPRHQRETPGKQRSRRGVKTIVRLGEKLNYIRNHRPDLQKGDAVTWINGSGAPLAALHKDAAENGIDVRGSYGLVSLDHYPLRSLNSYLVKMFRGDVVVKDKMVSQRYWRQRDRQNEQTSTFERQKPAFQRTYDDLLKDEKLHQLHKDCCAAHEAKIVELLADPVFQTRKAWIKDNIWAPEIEKANT
ncbi:MAG: FkbM family methyltransferase [Marinosulfonomonas sp.]|nr:FkbM family methyltransferase [Marinosulfonomonas sp.]